MKTNLITLSCLFFWTVSFASVADTIPYIISENAIAAGIAAHDSGDYHLALEHYDMVQPGDSNYVRSISQKAYAYLGLKDYPKAIALYDKGLSMPSGYRAAMMSSKGTAYDNSGDRETALKIFDEGLEMYPHYYQLHYNRAVTLMLMGREEEALEGFQKTILLRPYHTGSHYQISRIMMRQDMWCKAMMSMGVYLAVNPSYNKALVEINRLVNDARRAGDDMVPFVDNAAFHQLDLLLKSRVAVKEGYETDLVYRPYIASQFNLFFNQIKYDPNSDDFWMKFYVPFYTQLKAQGADEAYIYSILSSTGNEKAANWLTKNNKLRELYIAIANEEIDNNRLRKTANLDGTEKVYSFWYFNDGGLSAIGNQVDDDHYIGPWEFYHYNNELQSKGSYNQDGDKIGKWSYYDNKGNLIRTEAYNDKGEAHGTIDRFYASGQLASSVPVVNDAMDGTVTIYFECGEIKEKAPYKNGALHGKGNFFNAFGSVSVEYNYKEGKLNGPYKIFYPDGKLKEEYNYVNGMLEGTDIGFYEDGSTSFKANYSNNELDGAYVSYYRNGQIDEEGEYKNGKHMGEWKDFYPNGVLEGTNFYNNEGNLDGQYVRYRKDGSKFFDIEYVNGMNIGAAYYFSDGSLIGESGDPSGNFRMKRYHDNGNLEFECDVVEGEFNGPATSYFKNTKKHLESIFVDGTEEGRFTQYHKNGKVSVSGVLKNGSIDQYSISYDIMGNKISEGWSIDTKSDKIWKFYHANGNLSSETHYTMDVLNGWTHVHSPEGKKDASYYYEEDNITKGYQYDEKGELFNKVYVAKNKSKQELKYNHNTGEPHFVMNLVCDNKTISRNYYYRSGTTKMEDPLVLGMDDGKYKYYNPLGKLLTDGQSEKDMRQGTWTYRNSLGHVTATSEYVNGEQHGKYINYYYNNQIEVEVNYSRDVREGVGLYYDPEGNLQVRKHYGEDGYVAGFSYELSDGTFSEITPLALLGDFEYKSYFKNGAVSAIFRYKDGLLHGKSEYFNNKGILIETLDLKYGQSNGESKRYYNDGTLLEEEFYVGDKLEGAYMLYHPNGKKHEVTNYASGVKHGLRQYFDANGKELYKSNYFNNNEH